MKNMVIIISITLAYSCTKKTLSNPTTTSVLPSQTHIMEHNQTIYDFQMSTIDGKQISLEQYKGKVLLIVNVASKCGLTPQYAELQEFYKNYHAKGFEILGFPANNFMAQEPGTNDEIYTFCTKNYGVSFPMFAKISVKGEDTHPLYQFLTQKKQNGVIDTEVTWNFQKFLIDKKGKLITTFSPKTSVTDPAVITAISQALEK